MADEIQTIEGLDGHSPSKQEEWQMGLSVLDDLGRMELFDPAVWIEGAKAAAGGAGAILLSKAIVAKVGPMVGLNKLGDVGTLGVRAILSVAGGVAARGFVGDAFASGMVGGGAGAALAEFLTANVIPANLKVSFGLGGLDGYSMGALTSEERALLNDLPGEDMGEVSVESAMGEVGVEATGMNGLSALYA